MYTPAKSGEEAQEFIDRFQLMPLISNKLGDMTLHVNLPDLMKNNGYLCQRIGGLPYWLARTVV
jgi:hypothetical protein